MTTATPRRFRREPLPTPLDFSLHDRFTPGVRRTLTAADVAAVVAGTAAAILRHGLQAITRDVSYELGAVVVSALATLLVTLVIRDQGSLERETFRRRHRFRWLVLTIWLAVVATIAVVGPETLELPDLTRWRAAFAWSDLALGFFVAVRSVGVTRGVTAGAINPALLLVGSFGVLITFGTLLLLLPRCRAAGAPDLEWHDQVRVAAFTSTSACCVTGLTIVPTGGPDAYWSRTGQAVILGLIQVGGLGIMTCGAFFALSSSRSLRLRERATLRELFDPDQPVNVRRLVFSVLAFTFGCELLGAVLLSGLWPDKPPGERAWFSLFHAVSAFCNAGFDLTGSSLFGLGGRWQVWGVVAALVIAGGLGFGVLYNVVHVGLARAARLLGFLKPRPFMLAPKSAATHARLTVTTRLVLVTTCVLLVAGTAWNFLFEAVPGGTGDGLPTDVRIADAWFQSVTYRTAGFNTVDMGRLRPVTKLFAVVMMFIGASPVSTGGGVKTAAVAVVVLAIAGIMRGRPHAEAFGRSIPDEVVRRALAVVAIGGATLVGFTVLLAAFEDEASFRLGDLLFEAASACGTVGVSTGITARLSPPSQVALMAAMLLGRVGPLTILLGLAGQLRPAEYSYPDERVTLG